MPEGAEWTFFRKEKTLKDEVFNIESFLGYGRDRPPEKYLLYLVLKEMGWDYGTYLRQPDDLISIIEAVVIGREKAEIKEAKKHGRR